MKIYIVLKCSIANFPTFFLTRYWPWISTRLQLQACQPHTRPVDSKWLMLIKHSRKLYCYKCRRGAPEVPGGGNWQGSRHIWGQDLKSCRDIGNKQEHVTGIKSWSMVFPTLRRKLSKTSAGVDQIWSTLGTKFIKKSQRLASTFQVN